MVAFHCLGRSLDAIDHYQERAQQLRGEIEEERKKDHDPRTIGFVSFTTLAAASAGRPCHCHTFLLVCPMQHISHLSIASIE